MTQPCTIIIPVYNAFAEALLCVRSVLAHTQDPYRVLILDDCSPEGTFADFLANQGVEDPHLQIIRNERNLGFVKTCNLGMRLCRESDAVLLNSDTEVTPGWLAGLRQAAYSRPHVATATPLTNNGTICSVPEFLKNNELPGGYSLHDFAALVRSVSARQYPELPTCVGFCVYIRREVIQRIGGFDEESFGRGYGEENDFSCRAQAAGYVDLLDDATFVYHKGGTSFQDETGELSARNLRVLQQKHPGYSHRVQTFIAGNRLDQVHRRIHEEMLRRWHRSAQYSVLHVMHNNPRTTRTQELPGGTEYHVADLMRTIPNAAHWSLFPAGDAYYLTAHVPGNQQRHAFSTAQLDLCRLIHPALFDVIHVHHIHCLPYDTLAKALLRHGRYVVSLHDFRMCCPLINTVTPEGRLCNGRECSAACGQDQSAVDSLRATTARVLQRAGAVIHFSNSTKSRFTEILRGNYPWKMVEHGVRRPAAGGAATSLSAEPPKPSHAAPLKIAFLGVMAVHKGAHLIQEIIRRKSLPSGLPLEWHLIGTDPWELLRKDRIIDHGRYDRADLPAIMEEVSPHLVAILSSVPETYCYTLDESLLCGIPVISTPLGAPPERVRRHQCGWVLEALGVETFFDKLQHVVDCWDEYCAIRRRISSIALRDVQSVAEEYQRVYQGACPRRRAADAARLLRVLEDLSDGAAYRPPRSRLLAGRAIHQCESVLRKLKVRSLARTVALRVLPAQWQRKIHDLRLVR